MQMMLNGGEYNGKRILSRNSVRMMTTNQIGDLSLGEDKFGLGICAGIRKRKREKVRLLRGCTPGRCVWNRILDRSERKNSCIGLQTGLA